jgi:putative membrane protein
MMIWDGHGWGWGGWMLMTFIMILFWALVIGAIVVLLRGFRGGGQAAPEGRGQAASEGRSAEQILAERYARGEIEEDEYRRRLDVVRGTQGPTGIAKTG